MKLRRAAAVCTATAWLTLGALAHATDLARAAAPARAAATLEERVNAALQDFRAGRFAPARAEFAAALELVSDADSRNSLLFNIAACEYELGDYEAAERHFRELAEQDAGARSSALARAGLAALARGDRPAAQRHLARLRQSAPADSADRQRLEVAVATAEGDAQREAEAAARSTATAGSTATPADLLRGAPRRAVEVWARVGAGWDSNATQASLRDAAANTSTATASAYSALALGVALPFEPSPSTLLSPYYRAASNLLFASAAQELSEQHHEAGVDFSWTPSDPLRWSFNAAGNLGLAGLSQLSPYDIELPLGSVLEVRHGDLLRSSASLELRPLLGLPGYEWTSGLDVDAALGERLATGRFSVALESGVRWHAASADRAAVSPQSLPACGPACLDADYYIPLGYVAPRLGLRGGWAASESLLLSLSTTLEQRDYAGESYLSGLLVPLAVRERSSKQRSDWRGLVGVRAQYALDVQGNALWAGYTWRVRRSNIAYRADDPAHALDYTDANYQQHTVEAGLELRY